MLESVMWILLTKKTNINKQLYNWILQTRAKNRICYMDFANVGICYVDFAMPHCVFFLMIVAKYRNVFSCFWYCTIQKKIAEMQNREQKTDSRNASKKMQKIAKR